MNLLARAKSSTHLIFSFSSSGKHLFCCRPITALQQCNFYATRATQQLTKPKTQKFSESSSSVPQIIKKQTDAQTAVWPKPSEMPFQAKVANFVNLIGHVKIPVQFECDSDGKHFANTVISVGNEGGRNSLMIPVVFEGDLAHIVACHVKENDCIFVAGQLCVDPKRLVLMENLGKFHVVAENLNFVEGLEKGVLDKKVDVVKLVEEMVDRVDNDVDSVQLSIESELAAFDHGNIAERGDSKSGVSVTKKKDGDQVWDLWRDLVNNPLKWWDYRKHKADGLVKDKFPDFKQKESGEALWVSSAPKWVLYGLGKLVCDVKDIKPKQLQGGEKPSDHKLEDSWKNLVENTQKWWDNRVGKRNPKSPDFRHKETGEGLWLESSPVWALSRLPPLKGDQNATHADSFKSL